MVMGDKGTMFMGTRIIGRVYAITDKGGKRESKVIIQGLTQPNGLAFKDGSLYVFAINKVYRYDKIEDNLDKLPEPVELTKAYDLPDTIHHNWKYVAFGPDGKMYVQVGAELQHLRDQSRHPRPDPPATTPMAPAWRSSRAASATRSASTGIR
jgi:glucose/arabinose dehydrogenase